MIREGSWSLRSESDPRFNKNGRGLVGGLICPPSAKAWLEEREKELGCKHPDDLEFSYMKD